LDELPFDLVPYDQLEGCSIDDNCTDYRGHQTITKNGNTCIPWADKSGWTNSDRPGHGLEENYCRNPDNESQGIWCWINQDDYEFCLPVKEMVRVVSEECDPATNC
jgi:hypothetical protein